MRNDSPRRKFDAISEMTKLTLFSLGVLIATAAHLGAVPVEPEATAVYAAGVGGYNTYRIPVMVVATNGTVLAFCEGRKNGAGDSGKVDLVLKRSTDNGGHWSDQKTIWSDGDNCCGNPAPVVDRTTGVIWLLATWNAGQDKEVQIVHRQAHDTRRVYLIGSADNGVSWSKPKDITQRVKQDRWDWYATGPANGIQLVLGPHAGRLVIPCNHSELDAQGQPVSYSHVIYSDDHGATWHIGGVEDRDTNESTVTELSDGTLMHNMRITGKQHRRAVATSNDGGMSWSPVRFDDALIEPVCEGNILRYTWPESGDKSRILFSNPASLKRENLTVRVSYDEGATWSVSKVIYAGPSAYSCMTVLPDSNVGVLFECGVKNAYETIKFARLPAGQLDR
jgi:sialidase-1